MHSAEPVLLELAAVAKRFGGVDALQGVNLRVDPKTVHALVGENGAGKSTLAKLISGVYLPDAGEMRLAGTNVWFRSPREALAAGVSIIAQEPSLVPERSVVENVFLGMETRNSFVLSRREMQTRYEQLIERVGFSLPPQARAKELRVVDQLRIEILRAVAREAKLLIMDEPTAALSRDDAERLFAIIHDLRAGGTTIIYISHFLEEVLRIADRVTIMRDGRVIRTRDAANETPATLVEGMIGRKMTLAFPSKATLDSTAPQLLSVEGLSCGRLVRHVSFNIRVGEILGLAGLIGSGRSEVARAIFGADAKTAGAIAVCGKPVDIRSPGDAVRAGIVMLPEDRKHQGFVMQRSVRSNVLLPHLERFSYAGVIRGGAAARAVREILDKLRVKASDGQSVVSLSGGNQQRVLFAKWLFGDPLVFIADEPTRGVDVGAKQEIYELIHSLAACGTGVLLISSEIEEVLGLAHRVLVMRNGEVVREIDAANLSEQAIMHAAFAIDVVTEPTGAMK